MRHLLNVLLSLWTRLSRQFEVSSNMCTNYLIVTHVKSIKYFLKISTLRQVQLTSLSISLNLHA